MRRRGFLRRAVVAGAAGAAGVAGIRVDALSSLFAEPHTGARRDGGLKLNQNENPLGPSPMARRAVSDTIVEGSRYPGALRQELAERLAAVHRVAAGSIVLGNGSTEVIRMAVQAVVARGGRVISAHPAYGDVVTYSRPFGSQVVPVPLRSDHSHDLERMADTARKERGPVLIYICNPNNPTGTLTATGDIEDVISGAAAEHLVVVDEAYHEYAEDSAYRSAIELASRWPNVLVLRTFSKIYGMAGLRVGYGVAHPTTAAAVQAFSAVLNLNQLGLAAAIASLDDRAFVEESRRSNRAARDILYAGLRDLGLTWIPSHTNFVMHRINGDLATYTARMRERNVQVGRPFPPMLDHNRISIGTPEEMGRFVETLKALGTT